MDCARCRQNIPLCIDPDADPALLEQVVSHAASCPSCRAELDKYRFLKGILGSMGTMDDIAWNGEQFAAETRTKALAARSAVERGTGLKRLARLRYAVTGALTTAAAVLFMIGFGYAPFNEAASSPGIAAAVPASLPQQPAGGVLRPATRDDILELFPKAAPGMVLNKPEIVAAPTIQSQPAAWLGLRVKETGPGRVAVEQVIEGGPAREAGMREMDQIIAINGQPVRSIGGLLEDIGKVTVGQDVRLELLRGLERLELSVKAVRRPHQL